MNRQEIQGRDPWTGRPVGRAVPVTTPAELDAVCRAAARAAPEYAALPLATRARALRAVAAALGAAAAEVVAAADAETALGEQRLDTELRRTRAQLEMFAGAVDAGDFLEVTVDPPDPDAVPVPRPDLRRMVVPIGPVAVFAAGNFPLAFSVAGGDTASALAAGCPVVVKAHEAHPGVSRLVADLVGTALAGAGAPDGVFATVYGFDAGPALVRHPAIAAVGFTGSTRGGRALFDLAVARPDPIPFYGELGSVNPVVVTPAALAARGERIAAEFVASFTQGSGQFCTKPGLVFLPAGHGLDGALARALAAVRPHPLLTPAIHDRYAATSAALAEVPGVTEVTATHEPGEPGEPVARLLRVDAARLADHADPLLEECFGPAALIAEYGSTGDLLAALAAVPAGLTGTVHTEPDDPEDAELAHRLLSLLARRAGRLIVNGWPTGVAVTAAMHHGGPWPATTSPLHTSVGTAAMRRFLRPVVYQSTPPNLLPDPLR